MNTKLLKLLLGHEFYEANKDIVTPEMFEGTVKALFETIRSAHDRYERDITPDELREIYLSSASVATRADRTSVCELIDDIADSDTSIGQDVASDILRSACRVEIGRKLAEHGFALIEGRETDLSAIQRLLDHTTDSFEPVQNFVEATDDVYELLQGLDSRRAWTFNTPGIEELLPGLSAGEFMIYGARPEIGKTAMWVSNVFGPKGFADQGASVLAVCNEEPAIRTRLRGVCSYTGMSAEEIRADPAEAKERYSAIAGKVRILDTVDMTMPALDKYVADMKPDIVVLDQIDKIKVPGKYNRKDEALAEQYIAAREIAKRRSCAMIGMTQASAEAEGKQRVTYAMLAESKTGKAAEADVICGIGKLPDEMESPNTRCLTFSKNKIGRHGEIYCSINPALSRYEA